MLSTLTPLGKVPDGMFFDEMRRSGEGGMSSQSRPRHLSCDSLSPAAEMSLFMLVFSELFPYRHEGKILVSFAAWRHSFFNPQAYTFCKLLLATRAVSSGYTVLSGPRCTKHPRDTVSVFRARRKDCQNRLFCSGSLSGSYSSCCWVWGGVPSAATVSCATSIAAGAEEILALAGTHPFSRKSEQVAERFAILSLACSAGKNGARWLSILLSTMR